MDFFHHGTGLVIDGYGILLRGPSGSGKSLLALALLDRAVTREATASLVADDQVGLVRDGDAVMMTAPANIAGKIELRGRGILDRAHLARARLHLVVDLLPDLVRMPEDEAFVTELLGVSLPCAPVPRAGVVELAHQILLVDAALAAVASR